MVLAVVYDDAHVLHRKSCERSHGEHFAHAFFHRRNELRRNRAALDLIDELETFAARERLDLEKHFAELAGAAALFLVAVMAFGARSDGLSIRNARRLGAHIDAILFLHLV